MDYARRVRRHTLASGVDWARLRERTRLGVLRLPTADVVDLDLFERELLARPDSVPADLAVAVRAFLRLLPGPLPDDPLLRHLTDPEHHPLPDPPQSYAAQSRATLAALHRRLEVVG